jgi:hypothetical protein
MRSRRTIAFILFVSARLAAAGVCDVRYGTFESPAGFTFQHTGTIDSFRGTLTRTADGFTIAFDVGLMAGTHMGAFREHDCTFYQIHRINGIPAFTGIQSTAHGQRITTSIFDPKSLGNPAPANFWADITRDSDIAEFLLIVSTYRSSTKEHH